MKKRSLFKRLLSGFVATAMALSICFSDKVFEDLFASADATPTVKVKFVDENGDNTKYVKPEDDTNSYRYFVLGALVKKADYTEGLSATLKNEPKLYAWQVKEFDPENDSGEKTLVFDQLRENDHNFKDPDSNDKLVSYNSSEYVFVARAYRYWGQNDWAVNNNGGKIEPTNIIRPEVEKYTERSSDTFPGYVPSSSTDGNTVNVRFDKRNVDFKVRVNFGKPTEVSESDYLYVLVEVEHRSHDKTYFFKQIVTDGEKNDVEYTVQDKNNHHWIKQNQTDEDPHEYYHGNEPSTKIRLFKASGASSITSILNGSNCKELKTGDFVKALKVTINGASSDPETPDDGDAHVTYYETITLDPIGETDNYTYEDILGSGISFGITADRFALKGHMQTNLAVNYFRDKLNGQNFECDLSEPSAGDHYVAYFAKLTDPTDISDNPDGKITIGNTKKPGVMHVDINNINRVQFTGGGGDWFGTLSDTAKPAAEIKNDVVDPTIKQMQAMSNLLASKEANLTPVFSGKYYVIDSREYPDGATIYVDADKLIKEGSKDCNAEFYKKENQTIVMNFKNTKNVLVDSYMVHYVTESGELKTINSTTSDGLEVDEQVMRKIVWNFNSCYNTDEEFKANDAPCVEMKNTAGIFLVPNPKTVTHMTGTTSGWIMTAGYFENTSGEWHFPYHKMKPYEAPKSTSVVVSKKAITGDDEIPGATLQIFDKVTGKNLGDGIWEAVIAANGKGFTALTTKVGELEDVIYGIEWTSGTTAKTVALRDGSYVLKETGTTFKSGGKEYKVVTSSFDFEITNGKITKVSKDVSEDNGTIKYTDTNNTITIRDAQIGGPVTYPVYINKTDVTGKEELEGATLTLTKADGSAIPGLTDKPWESKKDVAWNVQLQEGDYILKESGTKVTDENGWEYDVLNTAVKFSIDKDGNVTVTENGKADFDSDNSAETGFAVAKNTGTRSAELTICDAAKKTPVKFNKKDITGKEELAGATLTVYKYDATKEGGIGDKVDEAVSSKEANSVFKLELANGKYVLEETGTKVVDKDENEYDVIKTTLVFEVNNGVVTTGDDAKSDYDSNATAGYFYQKGTTIEICDAKKVVVPEKLTVKVDKKAITGDAVIKNAHLKIVDSTNKVVKEIVTSETETGFEVELENGTYTLTEEAVEGMDIVDEKGNKYKVIKSSVTFTIENGQITPKTGTVASKDEVDQNKGGVVYSENTFTVCDAQCSKVYIHLSKKDITGDNEVENAVITLYNAKPDGTKGDKVQISGVGNPWTSNGSTLSFQLQKGNYILEETGDEVVSNNIKYKVLSSTVNFTVDENGKVTVTSNNSKPDFVTDRSLEDGYAVLKQDEGALEADLTICDAIKPRTVVTINKTDVTGKEELKDATLTLFYAKADGTKGAQVVDANNPWTSDGSAKWTAQLQEGDYILKESGTKVTDKNGWEYDVLNTAVKFSIDKDGNVTVTENGKADFDSDNSAETGFAVAKNTGTRSAELTICDAAKKTPVKFNKKDITGKEELAGATLTVYKYDATKEGGIGERVNGAVSSKDPDSVFELALANGKYVLEETGTKVVDKDGNEYDVIKTTLVFEVNNGTVTAADAQPDYDSNATTGYFYKNETTIEICDAKKSTPTPTTTTVKFNKKDITGKKELAGATLTVYKYDATKEGGIGDKVDEAVSSKEADSVFELALANGKYVLQETGTTVTDNAGNEYDVIKSTLTFEVNNGTVTANDAKTAYDGTAAEGYFYKNETTIEICDAKKSTPTPTTTTVKFNKKDITGQEELAGATLTVYKYDESKTDKIGEKVDEAVSSKDAGSVFELQLPDGKYVLQETGTTVTDNAGNEYDVIKSTLTFEVNNGTVTANDAKTAYDGTVAEGYFYKNGTTIEICDAKKSTPTPTPTTTTVKFNKKDITGQEELAGATLTVYKYDESKTDKIGQKVDEAVSSKDAGSVFELQLPDGKYVLQETGTTVTDNAGNEYDVIKSTLTFEVNNGTVTANDAKTAYDGTAAEGYFYKNGTTIEICDAKKSTPTPTTTTVKFNKKDITGQEELAGATLTVYKYDESKTDKIGEKVDEAVSSKDAGSVFELQLPDGKYVLQETGTTVTDNAGNEYDVIKSTLTFEVNNGTVTANDAKTAYDTTATEGYFYKNETTIEICDAKKSTPTPTPTTTTVKFNKKDITGQEELAGATLTVYKYDGTKADKIGKKVDEAVSSKDAGSVFELQLPDGKYVLQETGTTVTDNAGNEYDVIKSTLTFEVNNGTVTATGAKTAYDTTATEGYFYKNETTIEICDAKKATSDDDSSKPSDDSSKPSGGDNDGDNDSSKPSGGDNDGDNDSNKGKKPSGGDNDGDNDSNKGKKPSGGDEDGDNTPNTGFAGSTFAAAALLAAVSVLAVMKKKDE